MTGATVSLLAQFALQLAEYQGNVGGALEKEVFRPGAYFFYDLSFIMFCFYTTTSKQNNNKKKQTVGTLTQQKHNKYNRTKHRAQGSVDVTEVETLA